MKYSIALITFILFYVSWGIKAQSLHDYLIEAAENNPGLKSSYLEFEASMERTTQVKALPDMNLSFGYFINPVETRVGPQRAKFSLSQMFPWFGTKGSQGEIVALNAQSKYQEFLDKRNELYYRVKLAYYPIYEIEGQIRWQEKNLDILKTYKRLSTTNFSNGKSDMVDVIRVDIMVDDAETELKLLRDQLGPLKIAFNRLLNRPDSMDVRIDNSLSIEYVADDYQQDSLLAKNPLLSSFDLKIESAHAQEEAAEKQGLPAFGVGIDYVIIDNRTDVDMPDNGKNAFMPMISMSLPIFRGKYKASVKEAQLIQAALVSKKEDVENQLISFFEMSQYELQKARQLNDLYDQQITKTRQAIDLLLTAYGNSGKDFEEVLRMQQELLKYEMAKVTAIKNYYVAMARIEYITADSN